MRSLLPRRFLFRHRKAGARVAMVATALALGSCRQDSPTTAPLRVALPQASVAASEQRILYTSRVDGPSHIFVMNADGSSPARLTSSNVSDFEPAWSPDGRRIAFVSARDTVAGVVYSEIYIMNADGTGITRITQMNGTIGPFQGMRSPSHPTWSPDGQRLAFAAVANGTRIFTMKVDGTDVRQLMAGDDDRWPDWSPDGTRIAWGRQIVGGPRWIAAANPDGTGYAELTTRSSVDTATQAFEPAWSPDGSRIAYRGPNYFRSPSNLSVMNADGTGSVVINSTLGGRQPAWSPDGSRIAFVSSVGGFNQIFVMNADGSSPTQITNAPFEHATPTWEPVVAAPPPAPYSIFDLGAGRPGDINNSGQVAFALNIGGGAQRGLLWTNGSTTDLGNFGGTRTVPTGINSSAQITGAGTNAGGAWRQFLWTDGTLQDLGPAVAPPPIPVSDNYPDPSPAMKVINERGQVAWTGPAPTGGTHAFTWDGYVVQDLGALPGGSSSATVINASGQIAGVSTDAAGVTHVVGWDHGTLYDLGTCPGGAQVKIAGLNNKAQVLVSCLYASGGYDSLNVAGYSSGQIYPLGTPPGENNAEPGGLTDKSTFFANGFHNFGSPQFGNLYTWSNLSWTFVAGGHGVAMNSSDMIVGQIGAQRPQARVWSNGTIVNLPNLGLTPSDDWSAPVNMNDNGDVLGLSDHRVVLWSRTIGTGAALRVANAPQVRRASAIGPILANAQGNGNGSAPKWEILMVGPKAKAKKP